MDPITIIVTAVAAGAALGLTDAAAQAIKDAYAGLRALIIRKYGDQGDVQDAVEKVEAHPDSSARKALLEEELEKTKAAEDAELLKAAQDLLAAAQPESAQQGRQAVSIVGDENIVTQISQQAGDHAFQIGIARDVSNIDK